jgi:nitroreductase
MDRTASEAAEQRRSIRHYTPETIPDEDLRELLRLVGRAPSAWNLQPWRFVVVRDPALKEQLMTVANNQGQVGRAPAVIVVYSDLDDVLAHLDEVAPADKSPEQITAWKSRIHRYFDDLTPEGRAAWATGQAYLAFGWLLLLAESRGFVTSPMQGFNAEGVKRVLGLPANATVTALMALGYPADTGKEGQRHPVDRTTTFR